jgi:hypothetical protein
MGAVERLSTLDRTEYVARMQEECRRIMTQIADAVNEAPTGNVIGGSEMQVRDLMADLRRVAYETAVQMRVDSTESTFSPSEGRGGEGVGEQGSNQPQRADVQRPDRLVASAVVRGRRGKRLSGGQAAG